MPLISRLLVPLAFLLAVAGIAFGQTGTSSGNVLKGRMVGLVTRAGSPVPGVRMTLFRPSLDFFEEVRTDSGGRYEFQAVPRGALQLGAASPGLEYQQRTVRVRGRLLREDFVLQPETHPGQWQIIGNTEPEFFDATDIAILMADGRIFYCHDTVDPLIFDPVTGTKTLPPPSPSEQGCMAGTVLRDGRILMAGGQDGSDPGSFRNAIPWVKTYNPVANQWTWLEDMQLPEGRWYPGLARLSDGSLLTMGGGTAPSAVRTDTCELFDVSSETWTFTGAMLNPSEFSPSALLHTGEVLNTWYPAQLYNPATGNWRAAGSLQQPLRGFPNHSDHSLVVLADGRALVIGVRQAAPASVVMSEIYDPGQDSWSLGTSPALVRFQTEVTQLPDGRILVAGGETEDPAPPVSDVLGIVRWCDLYHPLEGSWRRVADMNWHREYHAVTVLVPDGRVVTTGGTRIKFQVGPTSADIEAFEPPYLFRGVRPSITDISAQTFANGDLVQLSIAPATSITQLVLIGTSAHTHWIDSGIPRRLELPVQQDGATVTATLPADANLLPRGHYMVFAMVDDIPSKARIILID